MDGKRWHDGGECGCQVALVSRFAEVPRNEIQYCPTHAAAPDMAKRIAELERLLDDCRIIGTNWEKAALDRKKRIAELEAALFQLSYDEADGPCWCPHDWYADYHHDHCQLAKQALADAEEDA